MASQAKSSLKCAVCLESFKEPKVLPCCHSFCLKCLEGIVQKAKDKTKLTCPQCRTEHEVPPNSIRGFLNDYTLTTKEAFKVSGKALCQQCGGKKRAVAYCTTCLDVCAECLDVHRLKIFEAHKILPDGKPAWESLDTHPKTTYCTVHPEEALKLYCKTCKTLACLLCFVSSHNGHDIGSIDKQTRKEAEENILYLVQNSDAKLENFQASLEHIKTVEEAKTAASTPLKVAINEQVDSLISKLEKKRKQLLKRVDESFTSDLKELWAEKEYHETAIVNLQGGLNFAKRTLQCEDDTELLALCSQVSTQLGMLNEMKVECPSTERIEVTKVLFSKARGLKVSSNSVGEVCSQSSISGTVQITTHNVPENISPGNTGIFQVSLAAKVNGNKVARKLDYKLNATAVCTHTKKAYLYRSGRNHYGSHELMRKTIFGGSYTTATGKSNTACTVNATTRDPWMVEFNTQHIGDYTITLTAYVKYGGIEITGEHSVTCICSDYLDL